MGAILAKVLFSVGGRAVSVKTLLKIIGDAILIALIAGLLWLAYSKVRDHFQHIKDLESSNAQLAGDKTKLLGQVKDLKQINQQNAQTNRTTQEAATAATNIGNTNAAASTTRATRTKEISDAITRTAPTATPVDPIVTDTLDRLWN